MQALELLGHVAFALIALSFALKDMVWLRSVSIAASLTMIVYALAVLSRWQEIVFWNVAFVGINGAQLVLLALASRAAQLSSEERELFETLFRGFTRLEFHKLLRRGEWRDAAPGEVLVREGDALERVVLVTSGIARVEAAGERVAELRDGQFAGEMGFVTGERASATVVAVEPTRYLAWPVAELRRLLERNPSMRFAMATVLGTDMSRKLSRRATAQPS